MTKLKYLAAALVLAAGTLLPAAGQSQTTNVRVVGRTADDATGYDRPVLVDTSGNLHVVVNGMAGGSGASTAQGSTTSGQNGTLAMGNVVSGDQSYTVGQSQVLTMTAGGRLKVGVSSATNVAPAAIPATTLAADLTACQYRAATATLSDTWTGSLWCDVNGRLNVDAGSTATASNATTGTTLLGVGAMGWDATNSLYRRTLVDPAGNRLVVIASGTGTIGNLIRTLPFAPETTTALAANATFAGTARDVGGAVGSAEVWGSFRCYFRSDAAGTGVVEGSVDAAFTTPVPLVSAAVAAATGNTGGTVVPSSLFYRYNRCKLVNGGTANTAAPVVVAQFGG